MNYCASWGHGVTSKQSHKVPRRPKTGRRGDVPPFLHGHGWFSSLGFIDRGGLLPPVKAFFSRITSERLAQ